MQLINYFLYFIIYSFIGWIFESIYCSIRYKKLTNRGFLTGPFIPIYGFGGILPVLIFYGREHTAVGLFAASMLIASILEYVTSYLMEKVFNARWWDYSNDFLNIDGRICIGASAAFGVMSLVTVRFIHPAVEGFVNSISEYGRVFASGVMIAIIVIDLFGTVSQLFELNSRLKEAGNAFAKYVESAGLKFTDIRLNVIERFEESEFFPDNLKKAFLRPRYQIRRLKKAFPDLKYLKNNEFWEWLKRRMR